MTNSNLFLALGNSKKNFTSSDNKKTSRSSMPMNITTSYRNILQESIANVSRPPVRNKNNFPSKNQQIIRGDANGDGVIDKKDESLFVARMFAELDGKGNSVKINMKNADFSGDGKITPEDLSEFLHVYYRQQKNRSETLKGDANGDGKVDIKDADLVELRTIGLADESNFDMNAADMDGDGKITPTDVSKINKLIKENESNIKTLQGDSNGDGSVNESDYKNIDDYLSGKKSNENFVRKNSDVNDDGIVDEQDLKGVRNLLNGRPADWDESRLGDANGDGKINAKDADLIALHAIGLNNGSKFNIHYADFDNDGEITQTDLSKINRLVREKESNVKTLQGDSNGDGLVNEADYKNINNYLSGKESGEDFIRKNSDINGDGEVDKVDLQGIRNILDGRKIDWDESKRRLGDVNGDGKIDMDDATTILNYKHEFVQKKDFYWDNADVNHDGKIDLVDARRIEKFYNGNISSLDQDIFKVAPPYEQAIITRNSDVYFDLNLITASNPISEGLRVNVIGMSSDGTALEIEIPVSDGYMRVGWVSIENVEKYEEPQPPPDPVIYPQERYIAGYAIWTYIDEALTKHQGNDVVTVDQKVTVLDENENVVHIQYTNVKGELLDRYIPAKPPAYQAWIAQALVYKEALHDDGKQYNNEAVYQNDVITVLNEAENHYLVEYPTNSGTRIRWITKADVVPYEEPIIPPKPEHISDKGIDLIKEFEAGGHIQDYLKAYLLPGENEYTIGYGHKSADIKKGMTITLAQAEAYLRQDLIKAENLVKQYCSHLNLNQNQFDALVSFTFNCGEKNLNKLLHGESGNENRPLEELPEHMPFYRLDATKQISKGLERRRAAEVALFDTPSNYVMPTPNPIVEVDPPFTQGRAIRKTQAWSNPELTIPYSSQYEGLDANERITIKKASSDGRAYLVEYNSIYGGTKTRWVSAADIEEYKTPDVPQKLQELIDKWVGQIWYNGYSRSKEAKIAGEYLDSSAKECKEFASYVFNILWGTGYIGSGSTEYSAYNYILTGLPKSVGKIGTIEGLTASKAQGLFANAKSGDFVQMKRSYKNGNGNYGPHSAIIGAITETGVWFLEANAKDSNGTYVRNKINYTFHSFEDLAKNNSDMSIYYAK